MSSLAALTVILFMAGFTEWMVERLVAPWLKGRLLNLAAIAIGVGLCLAFQLDVVNMLLQVQPTIWGQILTGIIVGAGSDAAHSFIKRFLPRKQ